ncbi:MAG: DNA-binding protein [Marinilabiliales bacterium]|nr:MAG: DNA-binding protein [Marinilabiliales bacterium]
MGRAKETFGKKEVRNRKEKKRKDKEKRREERKEQGKTSADDMIAYVDEFGNITSTPPDPEKKKEKIDASKIELGVPKRDGVEQDFLSKGVVKNFDDSKGFGFITLADSNESIFIHINDCIDEVKNGDKVEFDVEKGPKGLKAKNVKLVK